MKRVIVLCLFVLFAAASFAQGSDKFKNVEITGTLKIPGAVVEKISKDSTTTDGSDSSLITERAAKAYARSVAGGGGTPNLQQVTDAGNTTTNNIIVNPGFGNSLDIGSSIIFNQASGSRIGTLNKLSQTGNRVWSLPDATGTLALLSDLTYYTANNGLTLVGGTNFQFGGAASNDIDLDLSGHGLNINSGTYLISGNSSTMVRGLPSAETVEIGDPDNNAIGAKLIINNDGGGGAIISAGNGTEAVFDGAENSINLSASSIINLNSKGGSFIGGDVNNAGNGTKIVVDDSSQTFNISSNSYNSTLGSGLFNLDFANHISSIGDLQSDYNSTVFTVDDANGNIRASGTGTFISELPNFSIGGADNIIVGGSDMLTMTSGGTSILIDAISNKVNIIGGGLYTNLHGQHVRNIYSITSSALPNINVDDYSIFKITALATAITGVTGVTEGTPYDGQQIEFQLTAAGAPYSITWGGLYVNGSVTMPTSVTTTTTTVRYEYFVNSSYGNNKWVCTQVF